MINSRYAPGVNKLIHHLDHLQKLAKGDPVAPLHVSLWPNDLCQLNCPYCCGRGMKRLGIQLTFREFSDTMDILKKYGTKAIEFSGVVGDPLLWTFLDDGVDYAHKLGLKLSLITNGLGLKTTKSETLSKFEWIRVSIQSLAHMKMIDFENIPTRINGSFIVHNDASFNAIKKIYEYAKEKNIVVRIAVARPCTEEWEDKVRVETHKYGDPLFFAEKMRGVVLGCYMAWIRAAIDWNGNFLPCPSIELNHEFNNTIPADFTLCHISKLEEWLLNNKPKDMGFRCSFCNCGKENNDFVHNLLNQVEDVDFV